MNLNIHDAETITISPQKSGTTYWTDVTFLDANGKELLTVSAYGVPAIRLSASDEQKAKAA